MYCPKCGKEMTDDSVFCSDCGVKLQNAVELIQSTSEPAKLPANILVASILSFVWAALMGIIVILQIAVSFAVTDKSPTESFLLAGWNSVIMGAYIVFGIGLLKLKYWAYDWSLWSNILNAIWGSYQLFGQNILIQALLLPVEISIIVLLLCSKSHFKVIEKKDSILQWLETQKSFEENNKQITEGHNFDVKLFVNKKTFIRILIIFIIIVIGLYAILKYLL